MSECIHTGALQHVAGAGAELEKARRVAMDNATYLAINYAAHVIDTILTQPALPTWLVDRALAYDRQTWQERQESLI